ncbi:hypothetical protein [Streptomyces sp. NRRL S-1824]|uniref:hypothetical protein n=1 Tax=Streptomyces sp. NRRL S-1824 TaxID=1463889 RepID=UPI0004CA699C|nr:hypothetical protein [Streptomyces sp. NRRL S-1824]
MSEEQRDNAQTSEVTPDGAETTDTATPGPEDAQLGDAGKKALQALRAEVKELKAKLKAQDPADAERDASDDSPTSDDARDAVTVEPTPQPPRFQGTGDGGARTASQANPQLTRDDLSRMSPAAIEKARRNGQLRNLLSGK